MDRIILSEPQQRHLRVSLLSFEKALRLADRMLIEADEVGILYYRKLHLNPSQRTLANEKIVWALHELADLVKLLGLESVEENPARTILSEMSVSWANLVDCHSDRMEGFGKVDAETAAKTDPAIDQLERIASELIGMMSSDAAQEMPNPE